MDAVSANPAQIGPGQTSTLSVMTTTEQQAELYYNWSAKAGVFLQGTDRKYALWQAPSVLGSYECQVSVSNGKSVSIGKVRVEVVEVPVLQVSTDALDFSYDQTEPEIALENIGQVDLS